MRLTTSGEVVNTSTLDGACAQLHPYDDPAYEGAPINLLYLMRRLPGRSVRDFRSHWRDVHGPIACRVPGLSRYRQLHVSQINDPAYMGYDPPMDGIAEFCFASGREARIALGSSEWQAMEADEPNFFRYSTHYCHGLVVEDRRTVVAFRGTDARLRREIWLCRRHPDLTVSEFRESWARDHGSLAAQLPGVGEYVQLHVRSVHDAGYVQFDPPYDGVIIWSIDPEGIKTADPEVVETIAQDEFRLFAAGNHGLHGLLIDESVTFI